MAGQQLLLRRHLPEMLEVQQIADKLASHGEVNVEEKIIFNGMQFPIISFCFGVNDPSLPVVAFFGGVHGLERIGTQVINAYLHTFKELLKWDELTQHLLENCRVLFYPMVNPVGMYSRLRSNPRGVDIMRNAPVDAEDNPVFLVGGHRISRWLPWYRGRKSEGMEAETQALCNFVRKHIFPAKFSTTLDVHSGFGSIDRLWFPYAKSRKPLLHLREVYALKRKLDQTLPNHVYRVEPQSAQYVTHGDVWDYLYDENNSRGHDSVFLPLTLEMGSWLWVKKNPRQLFSTLGAFHPLVPHRTQRILRRHLPLIDFLIRATTSYRQWLSLSNEKTRLYEQDARALWFAG